MATFTQINKSLIDAEVAIRHLLRLLKEEPSPDDFSTYRKLSVDELLTNVNGTVASINRSIDLVIQYAKQLSPDFSSEAFLSAYFQALKTETENKSSQLKYLQSLSETK